MVPHPLALQQQLLENLENLCYKLQSPVAPEAGMSWALSQVFPYWEPALLLKALPMF